MKIFLSFGLVLLFSVVIICSCDNSNSGNITEKYTGVLTNFEVRKVGIDTEWKVAFADGKTFLFFEISNKFKTVYTLNKKNTVTYHYYKKMMSGEFSNLVLDEIAEAE